MSHPIATANVNLKGSTALLECAGWAWLSACMQQEVDELVRQVSENDMDEQATKVCRAKIKQLREWMQFPQRQQDVAREALKILEEP